MRVHNYLKLWFYFVVSLDSECQKGFFFVSIKRLANLTKKKWDIEKKTKQFICGWFNYGKKIYFSLTFIHHTMSWSFSLKKKNNKNFTQCRIFTYIFIATYLLIFFFILCYLSTIQFKQTNKKTNKRSWLSISRLYTSTHMKNLWTTKCNSGSQQHRWRHNWITK